MADEFSDAGQPSVSFDAEHDQFTIHARDDATSYTIRDFALFCRLLDDERGLRILLLLLGTDERAVHEICTRVSAPQTSVSHFLALFRISGLVQGRRDGKENLYTVTDRARRFLGDVLSLAHVFATAEE